jgi:hypothetical protein
MIWRRRPKNNSMNNWSELDSTWPKNDVELMEGNVNAEFGRKQLRRTGLYETKGNSEH